MKKVLFAIFFVAAALAVSAAAPADTVSTFVKPERVTIVEGPDGARVDIRGRAYKASFSRATGGGVRHTSQSWRWTRNKSGWDLTSGGLVLGFVNTPGAPAAAGFEAGKSLEIGMLEAIAVMRRLGFGSVSLGVGFDWRNYRSTTGTMFEARDGKVSVGRFDADTDYRYSRLKIFSLQFPLLYNCRATSAGTLPVFVHAGAIFNWNSHGSVKSAWRDGAGAKLQTSCNDIGQRKFSIDFLAGVSVQGVGAYVRYSPYKVLTGASAPQFTSLSAGLMLLF